MISRYFHIACIILVCLCAGCKKYNRLPAVSNPAYIRVFNDIATAPSVLNNGDLNTFITFIMDPVMDKSNIPITGSVVGDYMASRQTYNISYPVDAGKTIATSGNVNYEYPGKIHVPAGPNINGFDCSSWAQLSSGSHRIVFVSRPRTSTPFDSLTEVQRSRVLVDTTFDFVPGEVYTVEATLRDVESNTYGAYIRREEFTHTQYSADSVYVAVYNISASINPTNVNVYSPYQYWFTDSLQLTIEGAYINYFFNTTFDNSDSTFNDTVYTPTPLTVNPRFSEQASYAVLPLLPRSGFFDLQGNLDAYGSLTVNNPGGVLGSSLNLLMQDLPELTGTLPIYYFQIGPLYNGVFGSNNFRLFFWASPVNYNDNQAATVAGGEQPGFEVLPNLNLITGVGDQYSVYPSINILEVVNDRVYMTQVQKAFTQLPNN